MAHAPFVHLRVHSAYSLSEGAIKVADLVALAEAQAMPALAITDTGNLFGAMEFSLACAEAGVQPVIGTLLGIAREEQSGLRRPPPDRIALLAQDEAGYRNLCALSSKGFLETESGEPAQVSLDALEGRTEGLVALAGALDSPLGRLLADGQDAAARQVLDRLSALFPGRLYVELQRHGLEAEARIEGRLVPLADECDLPLVATNDVYFADAAMVEAHDALLCVAHGTVLADEGRRRVTPEHRFKSAQDMRALFADLPEAVDNTLALARRCAFRVEGAKPMLPAFPTAPGASEAEALRALAEAGLEGRLAARVYRPDEAAEARAARAHPYRERLNYELSVIIDMQFPGYFLIVADFIRWAKERGIPVGPGRGSGAGSVVAWALGITDLDPLRFGLLFERFLNPERVSMPDFDIDFCQDRRDEVIDYVRQKYGADRVAQIITFGKLQARAVLRDVGRVLELPYPVVDRICKRVPYNPANPVTLEEAIDGDPAFGEMRGSDPQVARLLDIALKLEGLYRHASTHAAGVVIADRPLIELVPLYRDPRSAIPATQFSMKYVELAGLVKFDFLGLKTLTVINRAAELIRTCEPNFVVAEIPLDDPPSFALLGRGETAGVFQLESSGMRDALRQLKPDCFEDIIAMVALYRPGPMENIPSYIARKHGTEPIDHLDPRLEDLLKETFGVIIYQEQVMEIARRIAGYSLGGADLLRRAMGKKIKAQMDAQREVFVNGAVERGLSEAKASHLFNLVAKFAGYGFNKSHAAAYALVAYQTAYLKAHYPVEFLAASMTLDMQSTDKLDLFRQELDRLAIALLVPDINRSSHEFTVETGGEGRKAIRYALAAI
ncbi:MAG TPA: DNA polymerase III subunit alpha, partial [Alphaproteobacteria bacterium]|nr:DNA polymerase III subunit alpha [Alphaproteobacteria bacterium]